MTTSPVETSLNDWLANNSFAEDMISALDLSNELFDTPTLNDDEGIYTIFKNLNSHLLSVLDGGDTYDTYYTTYNSDMSHGQIVQNNVICKRIGDVKVDKYADGKRRYPGGDPSYNTENFDQTNTNQARSDEISKMNSAYSHSPGIGIRLLKNDKWDNSFNTQGFSVHGDSSFNDITNGDGSTYFDFSYNFLIGQLENENEVQSHMHTRFDASGVQFIHYSTKNTIGEIENLGVSIKYKTTSDERLKTKIQNLTPDEGLELCLKLRPVRYNWKSKSNKQKEIGLIAQEVYKILDENYDENVETTQMIDYSFFNPIIISAVQCIKTRMENLKYIVDK